jgi:hypothetical protein
MARKGLFVTMIGSGEGGFDSKQSEKFSHEG